MIRAAEKLFLTQPGLTRRIQNLETTLGVALLDRQSKPFRPTAAGHEVYALARTALRAVDDLMAVTSTDTEPTGELKVGVPPILSDMALEQPIDRLRSAFPKLTLRVTAGWSPGLLENTSLGVLDAAIVLLPSSTTPPDTLVATMLGSKPMIVVAPRAFGLGKQPKKLAELSRHPWVLNQDGCGMRSALGRAMSTAGLSFDVAVEAFGSELQLSLVARGLGIGLTAPEALERSPHRRSLQIVTVTDFHSVLNVWLVHAPLPSRLVRPVALMSDALAEGLASPQARN